MKRIIILVVSLILFSCKDSKLKESKNTNDFIISNLWIGDSIISNLDFINDINNSCKINGSFFNRSKNEIEHDNANCVLSKIKFDYSSLEGLFQKSLSIGKNSFIDLVVEKTIPKNINNGDSYFELTLFSIKNGQRQDSIIIYKTVNFSDALVADTKYFHINNNNKIFLLDITEDETGAKVESWQSYKIDKKSGKVTLLKNYIPKNNQTQKDILAKIDLTKWEGIYWLRPFEENSEKKGNYFIDFFKENKDFGLSDENGFNYKISAREIDNKLYIYDEKEFTEDISQDKAKAVITKIGNEYYIESKLIKIERRDLVLTKDGYLINWAKSVEDIPENP
ncbi:MAG: hypothetical protein ABI892_00865 [Flavobacterium sp.]